jgi:hypothetical protein
MVEGSPHFHRGRWALQRDLRVECLATLCLSGPAAEELICGPIADGGDREDIAMARRCLLIRFSGSRWRNRC